MEIHTTKFIQSLTTRDRVTARDLVDFLELQLDFPHARFFFGYHHQLHLVNSNTKQGQTVAAVSHEKQVPFKLVFELVSIDFENKANKSPYLENQIRRFFF